MYIQYVNPHTAFPNYLVCLRWFTDSAALQFAAVWWRYPSIFGSPVTTLEIDGFTMGLWWFMMVYEMQILTTKKPKILGG